jgi:hypothetical protein
LPDVPAEPAPAAPQAVPLIPSVMRRTADTQEQVDQINKGREEIEPNPEYIPKDVWHNGERVKEVSITPYHVANPDDKPPHDPRIPSDNLDDDAFRPGWKERLDALGVAARDNKQYAASYKAAQDHYTKRMKEFNDAQKAYTTNKKDYEKTAKEERTNAAKERVAAAKADHGNDLKDHEIEPKAQLVDDQIKLFKPSGEKEVGTTPFDQVITDKEGKSKPVVDPLVNREIVTDISIRNKMPADQAMKVYLQLTKFNTDKANWRNYRAKGSDPAGNHLVVMPDGREVHMTPAQYRSLNTVVKSRYDAWHAEQKKEKPKSMMPGLGEMWRSVTGGGGSPTASP